MLLNITYNFGNHRTVTKKLDYLGHVDYILRLSTDELKAANLLFYHEPDKDELFAMQNLRAHLHRVRIAVESRQKFPAQTPQNEQGKPDYEFAISDRCTIVLREAPETLFFDEYDRGSDAVRDAIADLTGIPRVDNTDEICEECFEEEADCECPNLDSYECGICGGAEDCICDNNGSYIDCGGCGESVRFCECDVLFFQQKPYETDTNLLANADYFRKLARESNLTDLNNLFSDMLERGDTHIEYGVWPWLINILREKGYDFEECKTQSSESMRLGQIDIHIYLAGRNN